MLIGTATSPLTRRLAGESADGYRATLRGGLRTRPEVLLVGLAWLVALIPWFLLCVSIDAFGAMIGLEKGWLGPVTFAGIVAIGGAALYYGLRGHLTAEPIAVRRLEDAVPVGAFIAMALFLAVSGAA